MPDQYFGKYTGIVKDNRDDQNLGQIKVSVPAIFPSDETVIARAALPYGYFFVPENDAKVWIEFEGGDPGLPLWTGVQYVSGEWPGEAKANPPQMRVIKTAAGHLVIFDDKSDDEKRGIQIKDGINGHIISLSKDGITITDGVNSHSITLDKTGVTVKTQSGAQVQLASSSTTVDSGKGASIKFADDGVTIDGGANPVTISGQGVTINGGLKSVQVSGSISAPILLGTGASLPVLRLGKAIGNMGAPIVEPPPPSIVLVS